MSSFSLNNPSTQSPCPTALRRESPSPLGESEGIPILPKEFVAYTRQLFGEERWNRYLSSFTEEPLVSVRYNPLKQRMLSDGDDDLQAVSAVPWCRNAYYLSERPDFTLDPLFHAGLYYVQEASSMFLDEVLRQLYPLAPHPSSPTNVPCGSLLNKASQVPSTPQGPSSVLDLCAAPGGKSTLLRAALPEGVTLYSNEVNRKRANILYENIRKQGYPNVVVTSCSSADYGMSGQDFDIILTDVPCSGEGMFRKDPDSIGEWSLSNVMKCSQLQREIVSDVWPRLKAGGLLIYSTCTFNLHENEENILWILRSLGGELLPVGTKPEWNISPSLSPSLNGPVYRFIPGITRGEGLFMAVIRKTEDASHSHKSSFPLSRAVLNPDILFPLPLQTGTQGNASHVSPAPEGVTVALTRMQALQYLHREALILQPDTPKGIVSVTYRNLPLGYVKNIGSRANNLYPQEWRIRKRIV